MYFQKMFCRRVLDMDEMEQEIIKKTGLSADVVRKVLDAQDDYMMKVGLLKK